jgi:hypothetical protein
MIFSGHAEGRIKSLFYCKFPACFPRKGKGKPQLLQCGFPDLFLGVFTDFFVGYTEGLKPAGGGIKLEYFKARLTLKRIV